jgi:DNA-binding beta-propeller fold protein YncE
MALSSFALGVHLVVLAMSVAAGRAGAQSTPPLAPEGSIALDRVSGRIDHLAIDLDRKRLIVAELGNNTVDVVDLGARAVVHRIEGVVEPQGVAYLKPSDRIAVASAGDGTVHLFDGNTFAPAGVVALGDDADNLRVDRDGGLVAGYGKGALAWIDPNRAAVLFTIRLAGHPEGFRLHPTDGRAFVNVPDARQIAVVDRASRKVTAAWDTRGLRSNFPMAISADGRVLATVFRTPARLVLMDTGTGAVAAQADTCGDADDVFFDPKRLHLYVSCGAGSVDVFQQNESGLDPLGRVPTAPGARTSLFVPELDRLFVAARAVGGNSGRILVLKPTP